jgi:dihydroorotate dehydrogenase electron transfer subunit
MKDILYTILDNEKIAKDIYKMKLSGDCSEFSAPGQFVNIKIDGLYLRRPISIACYDSNSFTIIYKVVGEGTKAMSSMKAGAMLWILAPLGNGYDISKICEKPLLIGGGVGVPPMYGLALSLLSINKKPEIILGFNSKEDVFFLDEFRKLGLNVTVTTVDGSLGIKGFVTDAMETLEFDYICSCGPEPMLKAVYDHGTSGQFSFEARMACGFGSCMGCSCETKYGSKRICKDGPVLFREEIKW